MGVRTGVRCCGEVMAGGRGSAMVMFPLFRSPRFLSLRHGRVAGCAIVTTWLVAWVLEVAFEARSFEVEVASGEDWNFRRLSELAMPPSVPYRTIAMKHYVSREKGIILVHVLS
jgi:hypothetical protein